MGIFGGIDRALSKPGAGGLSMGERLAIFATAANGDFGSAMAIRNSPMLRAKEAQKQQFAQMLAGKLGPQYAETQGAGAAIQQPGMPGMPQAEAAPDYQWQAPQRTSNGLDINSPDLPMLAMQAKDAGYDMSGLLDVMKAQQPSIQFAPDGTAINNKNPRYEGMVFPKMGDGIVSQRNAAGQLTSASAIPNYAEALAGIEGAKAGAIAKAQSPYEFQPVPTKSGAPGLAAKSAIVGGVFTGQSPDAAAAAKIRAEAGANRDVEMPAKIANITNQLQTLSSMKELLPSVISGFAAGPMLQVARVKAATGDPKAIAQVKATETFINQGRQLVTGIIKQFGANPTEGERKYAEKMAGADAELNPETLAEGIRLAEQKAYRDLQTIQNGGRSEVPTAKPAPATTSARTRNEIYQTPRGPLRWTGTGWVQP